MHHPSAAGIHLEAVSLTHSHTALRPGLEKLDFGVFLGANCVCLHAENSVFSVGSRKCQQVHMVIVVSQIEDLSSC